MSLPTILPYSLPLPGSWPTSRTAWPVKLGSVALLVHDLQEYFLRPFALDSSPMPEVLGNLQRLIQVCRRLSVPVIYSAQPGEQSQNERGLLWDMWGPGIISAPGLEGFPEAFKPEAQDLILHKKRYSAFYETELQEVLRERGCHQLMIGGVYGHIGCLATATDAFMRGFQPFLIADAIADFSLLDHETALRQVARTCGVVHHTREVCSQLLSTPHEATSERQPAS
jgi:bifunctional isochorismate lyase / aryl carrier protein